MIRMNQPMMKIILMLALAISAFAGELDQALNAFKNQEYHKAFTLYREKALQGNATAQNALSYLYFNGLGTQKDSNKGLQWLSKAANSGDTRAQLDLGIMYLSGHNTTQDFSRALTLLERASDAGNAEAQYNVALMYYNGDGVDYNVSKAAMTLEKAAQNGHVRAKETIGRIYMQMLQLDKAAQWIADDDTEGQYLLGKLYCNKDAYKKAKVWTKKAMDGGSTQAKAVWEKFELHKY